MIAKFYVGIRKRKAKVESRRENIRRQKCLAVADTYNLEEVVL